MSKKKDKKKSETIQIYARVRGLMPWEPRKVSLSVVGNTVQNKAGKIVNEYDFKRVFKPTSTNSECFKTIAIPMITNVLKGFNAVLIAYGQTGSGKTFSMLGKPKLNIVGILPRMLAYMTEQRTVTKVQLSAVEAFGHHVAKIFLFDLFDPENQIKDWSLKKGVTGLDTKKARKVEISDADDAHDKIVFAHGGSHFAPTGKNPESSRGHVTFVATIHLETGKNMIQTAYFVMVDCAGSEGETAFTKSFKARVTPQVLLCRRLEAGTINTGLSQLQVVFNELRKRGKLTKTIGNGLRRVLHPFINTRTYLSVLFTLSPSVNNAKATESTLKFAVTAGMVKVKPVKTKGKVNFKTLVVELKKHIEHQEQMIDQYNSEIQQIQRQQNRTKMAIEHAKNGGGGGDAVMGTKMTRKVKVKRTIINDKGEEEEIEESVEEEYYVDADNNEVPGPMNGGGGGDEQKDGTYSQIEMKPDVEDAVMDVLDSSAKELLEELGDEFKEMFESYGSQQLQSHKNASAMQGRERTVTAEENDEAMKIAMEQYAKLTVPWQKDLFIKKKKKEFAKLKKQKENAKNGVGKLTKSDSKLQLIDDQINAAEADFDRLRAKQQEVQKKLADPAYKPQREELTEHAMELQIMLAEQNSVTENLKLSKTIIVDFLKDDGREALVQFFKMRNLV